jgi:hypothetical protein
MRLASMIAVAAALLSQSQIPLALAQDGQGHGPPGARPALPHGKVSKPATTRAPTSSPTRR